jgi:hypothetical protein
VWSLIPLVLCDLPRRCLGCVWDGMGWDGMRCVWDSHTRHSGHPRATPSAPFVEWLTVRRWSELL